MLTQARSPVRFRLRIFRPLAPVIARLPRCSVAADNVLNQQRLDSESYLPPAHLLYLHLLADNTLNQKWLDYHNFEAAAPPLNFDFGTQLGVGLSHTVKVQMTPMGTVDNSVAISNCTFQGRCHHISCGLLRGALASTSTCRTSFE